MASLAKPSSADGSHPSLLQHYCAVRNATELLCQPLASEDQVVQSMADVSPTKWHLAHTSWFFERIILREFVSEYRPLNEKYDFLFNSYYYTIGQMHARPRRGLLSRPTVDDILAYRTHVDRAMQDLLDSGPENEKITFRTALGLNHEQQHQELILTDIKHVLSQNPLAPAMLSKTLEPTPDPGPMNYDNHDGGILELGFQGDGFCFDNELPRHRCFVNPYQLASRPVSNREYKEFISDGGYTKSDLWLSDGWSIVCKEKISRPLYWSPGLATEFTLSGLTALDENAPVCHLSFYEADAFARWAGARLPTEAEWETVAAQYPVDGNFVSTGRLHPGGTVAETNTGQPGENPPRIFGDVWEWTSSSYAPYPGFQPLAGSLGEYNGKFMCSQMVLRGGSCATPPGHVRPSYRNFFYPHQQWQFSGIRLARDV